MSEARSRAAFEAHLSRALLSAVRKCRAEHAGDTLYSVALFTSGEYRYVYDSFATVEGLRQVAKEYLSRERYRSRWGSIERAMAELKWSPCDSPLHVKYEDEFAAANDALQAYWTEAPQETDRQWLTSCRVIHEAMSAALRRLASESVLATDDVVFNILMGDQSDEARLINAEELNGKTSLSRFRSELTIDEDTLEALRKNRWTW